MPEIRKLIQTVRSGLVAFVAFVTRIPTNRNLARSVLLYWIVICPLAVLGIGFCT